MAAATTMKRSAFGNVTNKGSELDRDEKRHHASTEGQLAEAPPSEEASSLAEAPESLSEWPEEETYRCAKANCGFGGIITGDQPAAAPRGAVHGVVGGYCVLERAFCILV